MRLVQAYCEQPDKPQGNAMTDKPNAVWVDASKELPPVGEYVLIHLTMDNWKDSTDPEGVYHKVAKLERGISMAEREKMKSGQLPDPDAYGWIMPNDKAQPVTSKRSAIHTGADEYANNRRPYRWVSFGRGSYFGQEVDRWMRIPPNNPTNLKETP